MVMVLVDSESRVYEVLGRYIDSVCQSEYLGTARGKATLYGELPHPLTPTGDPLPFMNLFYSEGLIEIRSVWSGKERGAFSMAMAPERVDFDCPTGTVEITFRPRGGGVMIVTLQGNAELAKTLKRAAGDCKHDRNREKEPMSIGVSR
jgi:hypothetical protein